MNRTKRRIMIALMCVSSVMLMKMAITPILAEIARSFPDASTSQIQIVYSLTSLVSLPVMLLVGNVTHLISKKTLCLLGLTILLVGGVAPVFFHSALWMLYLASCAIGCGLAIVNVISSALISDYFQGIDKGRVMGYQSATISAAGAIFASLSGQIAVLTSWTNAFLLFLLVAPLLVVTQKLLPADRPVKKQRGEKTRLSAYKGLIIWAALGFFWSVFMYAYDTNISMYIESEGFGNADVTGTVSAIFLFVGIPAGLLLGHFIKLFMRHVVALSAVVMALGMLILGLAHTLPVVYLGAFLYGVGFAVRNPASITFSAYLVPPESAAVAIAFVNSFGMVAGFFSPYVVNWLSGLFGGSFRMTFIICGFILAALSVCYFIFNPVKNEQILAESKAEATAKV